ncbi:MAG: hypothetical protein Hals2KO_21280 [Halioglobus sp.]
MNNAYSECSNFKVGQVVKGPVVGTFRIERFNWNLPEPHAVMIEVDAANHEIEAPGDGFVALPVSSIQAA